MTRLFNKEALKDRRSRLRHNATDAERKLWSFLKGKQLGVRFLRQFSIGNYILDFYCPKLKLAIELDSGQHNQNKVKQYDEIRTNYLQALDISVIRFWDTDILLHTENALKEIYTVINPS